MADIEGRSVLTPVTTSITINPSSAVTGSNCSVSGLANAYTGTNSTNYATLYANGASKTAYYYFTFNCSAIPSGATINSVTCKAKVARYSASYVNSSSLQMYANTTAKGSATNFSNASTSASGTVVTLSNVGTWTQTELNNARLRLNWTTASNASNQNRRTVYFHGADLTINYTYNEVQYEVTTTITNGTLSSPETQTVDPGGNATISFTGNANTTLQAFTVNGTSATPTNTSGNAYTYTLSNVTEDKNVAITFRELPKYTVSGTITNGSFITSLPVNVNEGGSVIVTFSGDSKTVFDHMSVNGTNVTPTESNGSYAYVISSISENKTIDVVFNKEEEHNTYIKVSPFEWVLAEKVYRKTASGWETITDQELMEYAENNKIKHVN